MVAIEIRTGTDAAAEDIVYREAGSIVEVVRLALERIGISAEVRATLRDDEFWGEFEGRA